MFRLKKYFVFAIIFSMKCAATLAMENSGDFEIAGEFLERLSREDPEDIQKEIDRFAAKHPGKNLVNEKDGNGCTLAHHIAMRGLYRKYWKKVQEILFNNNPDLTIENNDGDSVMHVIALTSYERASAYMFKDFIDYAISIGYDFSKPNRRGLTVLHIASINQYQFLFIRTQPVRWIIDAATAKGVKVNWDILSGSSGSSGSSALYYLINHFRFEEASALLDAGAHPGCGSKERVPIEHLEEIIELLPEESELLAEALELKKKIMTTPNIL